VGGFGLILSRDIRDLARTTAFRVLAAALVLLALALAVGVGALLFFTQARARNAAVSAGIGTMLYFGTLMPFLVLLWVFAGAILTKEKASGHLETLLATPLSPRTLALAKTSVIVLPGLAMAALTSLLALSAAFVAQRVRPEATAFAFEAPLLVVCWLGNPLLFSGLGALTVILAMRDSPDSAIVPSFVLGFGLMTLVPAGAAMGLVDLSSWAFAAAYLGAGSVEWLLILVLERGMTKERIVLSSRED